MKKELMKNKLDDNLLEKVTGGTGNGSKAGVNDKERECECGGRWCEKQIGREVVGDGIFRKITETRCSQCGCKKGEPSPLVVHW